jgi:anti-sigma regulatory factor (Ser/Thr protein kinase)
MACGLLLPADHHVSLQHDRDSEHIRLPPVPTASREARGFIRAKASVLDRDRLQDLLVLTSELVTNAVLHARTPLRLGITVTEDVVLVCVGDRVGDHPAGRTPSDGGENGRGIMLVRALADDWGVLPEPSQEGKIVWFLLRRPADAPPADTSTPSGKGDAGG